ncbi:MAG: phosphoglycerate kinase [Lutibacter sp.]|nr:MAG: phosphoglycerate kinase [Lutibacter sp.]
MPTINDFNFENKKALIRVDFNVPLDADFKVTDATRIESAKPTILKILEDGGSCVLMSHLGRPKGVSAEFSLQHIVETVSEIIGVQVKFIDDCVGEKVEQAVNELESGEILLLENLRFYDEEKKGDVDFAEQLSKLGDIYVNDAFGTAHRAHASTTTIAQFFEGKKCFGLLLAKEIESINKVLKDSKKPVTAVIGGAKVSSKIDVIKNIIPKVDNIIIGGGMAFTFLKVKGGKIGSSLVEDDKLELAQEILNLATNSGTRIHLPIDVIAADAFSADANTQIVPANEIPDGWMGLDVGPKTNVGFSFIIAESQTILWNGPLGVFEMPVFANGTIELGNAIADATDFGSFSLVGGGDSVAAVKQFNLQDRVSYVSTGGGAMLEMLEGKTLPGIEAILK